MRPICSISSIAATSACFVRSTSPSNAAASTTGGEPLAGILSGQLSLVWSQGKVVCDSPDKKEMVSKGRGRNF